MKKQQRMKQLEVRKETINTLITSFGDANGKLAKELNEVYKQMEELNKEEKMNKTLGLFEGRHDLPAEVKGYIFTSEVDPADMAGLYQQVAEALAEVSSLTLYVTGLTAGTTAVLQYCFGNIIPVTLMHYDRISGRYVPQVILSEQQAQNLRFDCGLTAV